MSSSSPQDSIAADTLVFTSLAFEHEGDIPAKHTCDGDNISPPLAISGVVSTARSLVLIMDDPDAPSGTFDHWVVFNIPPDIQEIPEGREPDGVPGVGTAGETGYFGPCPPGERHRYVFTLYALDRILGLDQGAGKEEVMEEMAGGVIQKAELVGYYER